MWMSGVVVEWEVVADVVEETNDALRSGLLRLRGKGGSGPPHTLIEAVRFLDSFGDYCQN